MYYIRARKSRWFCCLGLSILWLQPQRAHNIISHDMISYCNHSDHLFSHILRLLGFAHLRPYIPDCRPAYNSCQRASYPDTSFPSTPRSGTLNHLPHLAPSQLPNNILTPPFPHPNLMHPPPLHMHPLPHPKSLFHRPFISRIGNRQAAAPYQMHC